jgi:hypothetical protein
VKKWDSPNCKVCRVSRARPSKAVLSRDEQTGERKERRVMEGKHQFLDKGHVLRLPVLCVTVKIGLCAV